MTIRFTLAEKWQDKWFRKLLPVEKLLFLYMCDNCNIAGIWEIDLEQAGFSIRATLDEIQGAYKGLARGYETLDENHIWIKNFLKHQRNFALNPANAAHATIINLLLPYKDCSDNILQLLSTKEIEGLTRGLQAPISISIGKSKGISKGKIVSDDFIKFWKLYPKKVGKGKVRELWAKIKPSADLVKKILTAVEQQKKSRQWQRDSGQFIPYPATWLNQGRWDDEPEKQSRETPEEFKQRMIKIGAFEDNDED